MLDSKQKDLCFYPLLLLYYKLSISSPPPPLALWAGKLGFVMHSDLKIWNKCLIKLSTHRYSILSSISPAFWHYLRVKWKNKFVVLFLSFLHFFRNLFSFCVVKHHTITSTLLCFPTSSSWRDTITNTRCIIYIIIQMWVTIYYL